jgi:hypothetical protein
MNLLLKLLVLTIISYAYIEDVTLSSFNLALNSVQNAVISFKTNIELNETHTFAIELPRFYSSLSLNSLSISPSLIFNNIWVIDLCFKSVF